MPKRTQSKINLPLMPLGLGFWLVYVVLYLLAPMQSNPYNLSYTNLFLIKLTLALPLLGIWLIALYGVDHFRRYARLIQDSADGQALLIVGNGLAVVVFGLIMQTFIGAITPYVVGSGWVKPTVFLQNHLPVVLSLVGFSVILVGSVKLAKTAGIKVSLEHVFSVLFPYVVLSIIFAWYFYRNFQIVVTNGIPNFATGVSLAFYSIALPYIATWLIGIQAINIINEFAKLVPGSIYRRALRDLARGVSLTIVFSIVIQLLSLSAQFFVHLNLVSVLVIIYVLLIIYGLGFVFMARGARKLTLIEVAT